MTFDKPIDKIKISVSLDTLNYGKGGDILLPMVYILDEPKIFNGICSISIPGIISSYLHVGIRVNDKESFGVTYESYYFPNTS